MRKSDLHIHGSSSINILKTLQNEQIEITTLRCHLDFQSDAHTWKHGVFVLLSNKSSLHILDAIPYQKYDLQIFFLYSLSCLS